MIKQVLIATLFFAGVACTSNDVVDTSTSDVANQAPGDYDGIESFEYSDFPGQNTSGDAQVSVTYIAKNELSFIAQGGDSFNASVTGSSDAFPSLESVISAQGIYAGDNADVSGSFRLTTDSTGTLNYTYTRSYDQGGTLTITFNGSL